MWRKLSAYCLLSVCSLVYVAGQNETLVKQYQAFRSRSPFLETSRGLYGDLYNFSLLRQFRLPNQISHDLPKCQDPGKIDLYLLADSYLQGYVEKSHFCQVNRLVAEDWNNEGSQSFFDTQSRKLKILLLEITERNVFLILKRVRYIQGKFQPDVQKGGEIKRVSSKEISSYPGIGDMNAVITRLFFNPLINQNLESFLFDNALFRPVREAKAGLNYRFFGRMSERVSITAGGEYLVLAETVAANTPGSSFRAISDAEFRELTGYINEIHDFYKRLGFDDIYLSIIPNPASILGMQNYSYNNLIPRLANDSSLRMKMINVFPLFEREKRQIYSRSDSHWVTLGLQIWLEEVNAVIAKNAVGKMPQQ